MGKQENKQRPDIKKSSIRVIYLQEAIEKVQYYYLNNGRMNNWIANQKFRILGAPILFSRIVLFVL